MESIYLPDSVRRLIKEVSPRSFLDFMVWKGLEMPILSVRSILLTGSFLLFSLPSYGQQLSYGQPVTVYSYSEDESEEQSMRDQTACATWARRSSGYNQKLEQRPSQKKAPESITRV